MGLVNYLLSKLSWNPKKTLSQNILRYHWLSVPGNSSVVHCGIPVIMLYWLLHFWHWLRPGPPSEQAQVLSDYVQQIINDTHIVDHTQLCIEEGEKCWLLHCDVLCCNYDGMSKSMECADLNNIIQFGDIMLRTIPRCSNYTIQCNSEGMSQVWHVRAYPTTHCYRAPRCTQP